MLGAGGIEVKTLEMQVLPRQSALLRAYSVGKGDRNQLQKD